MSMYCYQCQETAGNLACTKKGVCGKEDVTSNLQDLLIYILQGVALNLKEVAHRPDNIIGIFLSRSLFSTITNANFSNGDIRAFIK